MENTQLVQVVRNYLDVLHTGDCPGLLRLFAPGGRVYSPFLGELPADEFYEILARATTRNVITPIDILASASGARRVAAYFRFEWTVLDGSVVDFQCLDMFDFDPGLPLIAKMTIIHDSHLIRQQHGNKYDAVLS